MRTGFIILCCLAQHACVLAQSRDSIVLAPVTVYGLPDSKYLAGLQTETLDSTLKSNQDSHHLGEVISLQLPVYFRNYGNGMLSGISMRGTSPQHTAVLWNGININSFSLGQSDFSILPASAFDEIKVHEGAGSARYGSGAFGGTVLLNSNSPSANSLRVSQEAGSFGRYFSSLNASAVIRQLGFQTRLYNLNSKNNFTILQTGERQQHAGFRQSGILQDIVYNWSKLKSLSLHYWYHDADRNIQPGIGQFNASDNQQDRNHRLSIRYQGQGDLGLLSVYGGYVNDVIVFNGSKSTVERWIAGARNEYIFPRNIHVQAGAEWTHIAGKLKEYNNGKAVEDRYDFTVAVQRNFGERLSLAFNARQPVVPGFNAPFLPYLGADYLLIQRSATTVKLRGSVSKNYRIPTLNDRYWQGAGDKNLLPETTHAAEGGWILNSKGFELSNTWFAQKVDQWIQWVPQANGVYRPRNIKQVVAEGSEIKLSYAYHSGEFTIRPQLSYQYTSSVIKQAPPTESYTLHKQLIYTPKSTANAYVHGQYKKWTMSVNAQYSGKRFTEAANSNTYALSAYAIFNLSAGKYWTGRHHRFDLHLSSRNILNTDYQLYAGYALPGRSYSVQFTYKLNN